MPHVASPERRSATPLVAMPSMPAADQARTMGLQPVAHEPTTAPSRPSTPPGEPAANGQDLPPPRGLPALENTSMRLPSIARQQMPTSTNHATKAEPVSSVAVQAPVTPVAPGSLPAPRRSRITIGRVEVQVYNQPSPSPAPQPQPVMPTLSSRESLNQLRSEYSGLDRFWLQP
jgi:hypothetical protein